MGTIWVNKSGGRSAVPADNLPASSHGRSGLQSVPGVSAARPEIGEFGSIGPERIDHDERGAGAAALAFLIASHWTGSGTSWDFVPPRGLAGGILGRPSPLVIDKPVTGR